MARRLAIALLAVGAIIIAWYIGWGVKGCDDFGGNPLCDRMDRDGTIYVVGLLLFALGLALVLITAARRRLRKLDGVQSQ